MKPDEFMNALKINPHPEFEADLRQRLTQIERKQHLMLTIKRSTGLAAAFIALTFVTLLIAAPDVLAQMGNELERIAGFKIERAEDEKDVPIPDASEGITYRVGSGLSLEEAAEQYGFVYPDMSEYGLRWVTVEVFVPEWYGGTCPMISGVLMPIHDGTTTSYETIRASISSNASGCTTDAEPSVRVGEDTVITEVNIGDYSGIYIPGAWSCFYREGDDTMDCSFDTSVDTALIWHTDEYRFHFSWIGSPLEEVLGWMGGEVVATYTPTATPTQE